MKRFLFTVMVCAAISPLVSANLPRTARREAVEFGPTAPQPAGAIIYVDVDAVGANNGTSWADAYTDLQAALADASGGGGTEVWVAEGTYTPAGPGGSRSATFTLINGVSIYGGFVGDETMLSQRRTDPSFTWLSGDLNQDDDITGITENSFHVVTANNVNSTAVLDAFTIDGGNSNGGVGSDTRGGGIFMSSGSATFRNCTISNNTATGRGGGAYIDSAGGSESPTFRSCAFVGNSAGSSAMLGGGAIWAGGNSGSLTVNLIRCYVAQNSATGHGGGIALTGSLGLKFLNAVNCFFFMNSTDSQGGAFWLDPAAGGSGAALTNCEFVNNSAANGGGGGGGGGAIRHWSGTLTLTNCTLTGNSTNLISADGGGIYTGGGTLVVGNSILWGNTDSGGSDESAQIHVFAGSPTVNYGIVQGGWSGLGSNNLSSDPLFFNTVSFDNRVSPNSPAVDSGDNSLVPTDTLDADQDGNTNEPVPLGLGGIGRFSDNPYLPDTGNGTAPIVDRGAWEVRQFVYLYVDSDGLPGVNDWAGAYANLQDALTEAQAHASAQIWIAAGTYYPDIGAGITMGDRTATFQLRNHVEIYGGFLGDETDLSERDVFAHYVFLSGDLNGDDLPGFVNRGDNSLHVVTASGTDNTARLDGAIFVHGGNANVPPTDDRGGGCYNDGGDAVFSRVTFQDNRTDDAGIGGGMYNVNDADPTLELCQFRSNYSGFGGGLGSAGAQASPFLYYCTVDDNTANFHGGGIAVFSGSTMSGEGALILSNTAPNGHGGGMHLSGSGAATWTSTEFTGNSASKCGGGVALTGPGASTLTFKDSIFFANVSMSDIGGGAIVASNAPVNVVGNVFLNNSGPTGGAIEIAASGTLTAISNGFFGNSAASSAGGGALHMQGGGSTASMTNCVFSGNDAVQSAGSKGGAIAHAAGDLAINNCTFSQNSALVDGGGIETSFGTLTVNNSIFWENSDGGGMDESAQIHNGAGIQNVNYSVVQGGWTGTGSNNFNLDPMFIDADGVDNMPGTIDDNLRLQPGSPVSDSGDNAALPLDSLDLDGDLNTSEAIPLDLAGNSRVADDFDASDTGAGSAPFVDPGAYEVGNRIRYVDVNATGISSGLSWADASLNLHDSLSAAAEPGSVVNEIWVAAGTYKPDVGGGQTPGDRTATFQLGDNVAVYGGFAGGESMVSERDPTANICVLDGDLNSDDGPNFTNRSDNSCHVVMVSGNSTTTILDGFTIRGGQADCMPSPGTFGGGLVVNDPTSPKIQNCRFTDNFGNLGGAIAFNVALDMPGDPEITNCKFDGNQAFNSGGAIRFDLGGTDRAIVTDCTFEGNQVSAGTGGGIRISGNGIDLNNCYFAGNDATYGGGLYSTGAQIIATGCDFVGNSSGLEGGGVSNAGGADLQLFNCNFRANTSDEGGGLHSTADLLAVNCVFNGNSSLGVGGVYNNAANPAFVNCTFADNGGAGGGGFVSDGGNPLIANSIFWGNSDKGGNGQDAQIFIGGGALTLNYSLVQGMTGSLGGVGNISDNPLFVNAFDGDYRVQAGSPAIDAGNSMSVPADSADLDDDANTSERTPIGADGLARFYDDLFTPNTGVTAPPLYPVVVDMGAFEFGGEDCNHNGVPDDCDVACGAANGPCDVPNCGLSVDMDMNGLPDECANFTSGCSGALGDDWSCFNNWVIPGDVYPDNDMTQTFDVELDMTDNVFLDVDVTIDSLRIIDNATLRVTQTGSAGDLIIATEAGLTLEGAGDFDAKLYVANNRLIDLLCGQVTVINGEYGPNPGEVGPVGATMECETLSIRPGGLVELDDTMQISASMGLTLDGSDPTLGPCSQDGGKTPPILRMKGLSSVDIDGAVQLSGSMTFVNGSTTPSTFAGDFNNSSDTPQCFDWSLGAGTLNGTGAQTFEVGGEDLGTTYAGFNHPMGHTNYSMEALEITGGTNHTVRFRNTFANTAGYEACNEALYVRKLTLRAGSTITLEDARVYYEILVNEGATVNTVGCGQLVNLAAACTSTAQCDDGYACTYDVCMTNNCVHTAVSYGNVNGMGPPIPNLDDILCVLGGFANSASCPNADISPCTGGNNVINLDDILGVLAAFAGANACGCVP